MSHCKKAYSKFRSVTNLYLLACCSDFEIKLYGNALKYKREKAGIYRMQPGFTNGQRYWTSFDGNAIWYSSDVDWNIGHAKDLGTSAVSLFVPIKDPSIECPHDNLTSNWRYTTGSQWYEDKTSSVVAKCIRET